MFFTPHLFTSRNTNTASQNTNGQNTAANTSGAIAKPRNSKTIGMPHWSDNAQTLRTPKIWGQKICIIPRSQCTFRRIAVSSKSKAAQKAALLRLQKEAMHTNHQFKIVVDSDGTKAGAWEFEDIKPTGYTGRTLPETMARLPHDQGARLVQMIEGFEGQIWHDTNLIASRWWPTQPTQQNWSLFARSLASDLQEHALHLPTAQSVGFRPKLPYFDISQERIAVIFSPKNMALTSMMILASIGTFLATQYTRNSFALRQTVKAQNDLSGVAGKILSQRRRSLGNMKSAETLSSIGHSGTLVLSLRDLAMTLKNKDLIIKSLNLRDEEIEIELQGDIDISIPDLVTVLDEMPSFTDTNISLARQGVLMVKADIISPHDYTKTNIIKSPNRPKNDAPIEMP